MKTYLIGVGGATCSGKTTLAKHLQKCLPGSFIVHQDDFAPPVEHIPFREDLGIQDWDDPEGAIDWPRMRAAVDHVKKTGKLPEEHKSHHDINSNTEFPLPAAMTEFWKERFTEAMQKHSAELGNENEIINWAIMDGFLLYYDKDIREGTDVRLMLRVPHTVLKARRDARKAYMTAEGSWWQDPPNYWEQIVYPAYVKAHKDIFTDNDVENGKLIPEVSCQIILLEANQLGMPELLNAVCHSILAFLGPEAVDFVGAETPAATSPVMSDEE